MTSGYIFLLCVETILELFRYTICVADRTVHSNVEQHVDMLQVFKAHHEQLQQPDDGQ